MVKALCRAATVTIAALCFSAGLAGAQSPALSSKEAEFAGKRDCGATRSSAGQVSVGSELGHTHGNGVIGQPTGNLE